jgi:ABC-2 type transport system ATP-binding protein
MKIVCGLLPPDQGGVKIGSVPYRRLHRDLRVQIGYCPQTPVIWNKLTCQEHLVMLAEFYELPVNETKKRIELLIEMLGLKGKFKVQAANLSGGQKRRLNIAMALIHNPSLLIMDEPFSDLDPQTRILVQEFLKDLAHHEKKAVLLSTHNIKDVDQFTNRAAIIHKGRLIRYGNPVSLVSEGMEESLVSIRIRLIDSQVPPGIIALTSRYQCSTKVENAILSISVPAASRQNGQLLTELEQLGYPLSKIDFHRPTLEDLFFLLTGRSLVE